MDDRRPNFVTAIARMTGLFGGETILTNLNLYSIPFSHFDIILECPGQTNGRTEVSSVAEVTAGVELP